MSVLPASFSFCKRVFLLIVLSGLVLNLAATAQNAQASNLSAHPLITQPVDEAQRTVLKGNTHPLARREFDLGTAPASLPMDRMLLVLKRSPEQEFALRKLLDDQQDKASPNYHRWLTPEQYGKQFGPTDDDIQKITVWLQSHGFQVGATKGRSVLEFSGSASQVQEAFHTTIHKYIVNGEQHWANANDPSIPTALTGAVAGVLTLHNFISKPTSHLVKEPAPARLVRGGKPDVTFSQNGQETNALAPQDYAVIYNMVPAYNNPFNGAGFTIGVVGRSNLFNFGGDVLYFHSEIGRGDNSFGSPNFNIVLNGPDPGDSGGGEEAEATLDSTWSSALAPGATVDLIVSGTTNTTDGIDLSELYIVENNSADIMTESFSSCELGQTDARLAGINALAEQAAAQGITYFVSTGDDGAEGCDDPNVAPAQFPISVNALASTPFNVAVGGTMFNENGNVSKYWTLNPPISETAISYIPENVWNESSLSSGLWAGSGGASAGNVGNGGTTGGVPKPSWQSVQGLNIPADGVRDLPDVSLTAASHDAYLLCLEGSCVPNNGQIFVYFISGTSASAPSMAGIMALVDESQNGRQGQANYVLYQLAEQQATAGLYPSQCNGSSTSGTVASNCIFNDVTVGNNVVPGEVGNNYQAGPGYDLTTGLGSVNVFNLVNQWSLLPKFSATTTALTLKGGTSPITISHGQSVAVGATVTRNSGTSTPTGDVVLYTSTAIAPSTLNLYHLSAGQASGSTSSLPGSGNSSYQVWAHYSGDGTFASSDSNQISVTVSPEPSTTTLSVQASTLSGSPVSSPFPFGSLVFVNADVAGNSGNGIPTGTVSFTDSLGPIPAINPLVNPPVNVISNPPLNSQGNTSIGDGIISFDAGNHTISATYSGDPSFNTNTAAPVSFAVSPGFAPVSGPTTVVISAPGGSSSSTVGIIASTGYTTAVSFACTSGLPAEATCTPVSLTGNGPINIVTGNIVITTMGPHTTALRSNERSYFFATILGGALPLAGILLIVAPKRRRWSALAIMMLLVSLILVPACGGGGGGGGGHQTDPGTPAGNYTVNVTATSGSIILQGSFQLIVQ